MRLCGSCRFRSGAEFENRGGICGGGGGYGLRQGGGMLFLRWKKGACSRRRDGARVGVFRFRFGGRSSCGKAGGDSADARSVHSRIDVLRRNVHRFGVREDCGYAAEKFTETHERSSEGNACAGVRDAFACGKRPAAKALSVDRKSRLDSFPQADAGGGRYGGGAVSSVVREVCVVNI